MDLKHNGTDTDMQTNLASKPKPPPQSLKPKARPSLPAKPAVASKPPSCVLQKSLSQDGPVQSAPSPVHSKEPELPEKLPPANSPSSPRTSVSRPKQPPPSLPKASPRGPSVHKTPLSVHKSSHTVQKIPPPLPKTAPKVSIKHLANNKQSSLDSSASHEKSNPVTIGTSSVIKVNQTLPNEIQSNCDSSEKDNEDFAFANLKSKFISSDLVEKAANKIAGKPKPVVKDKPKTLANADTKLSISRKVSSVNDGGKSFSKHDASSNGTDISELFVRGDCPENDNNDLVHTDHSSEIHSNNAAIQFLRGNTSFGESTVWFSKSDESTRHSPKHSPKHSPAVARKPLPAVPPKANIGNSAENESSNNSKDNASSVSGVNPTKTTEKSAQIGDKFIKETLQMVSESDQDKKAMINTFESSKASETEAKIPKPVPRKPTPAARPRPTPRKRLSIHRLSGSEDTFENLINSENDEKKLDGDGKSDILKDKCSDNKHSQMVNENKIDLNKNNINSRNEKNIINSPEVKLRKGVSESGQENHYRAIHKSVVRAQSHITEIEFEAHEENTVILRKKITCEKNVSDEEITLEQLKSIEHLMESSDDDGDHKFLSKVAIPVDDLCNNQIVQRPTLTKEQSVNHTESSEDGKSCAVKVSYEDFDDKSLLEPTSLLNEIEDILTRSYKHSSLMRSGSSPEKKTSHLRDIETRRAERSKSVDTQSIDPIRPPRPKKEQKRLRSMSQVMYDSCGSDTESLPDLSRNRDGSFNSNCTNISLTLGKAKPHPPKPKRHKLLRVQRSQSDITAMKSVVDKLDTSGSKSLRHRHMTSETDKSVNSSTPGKGDGKNRQNSLRKNRPSRKAPPPPSNVPPLKITPPSPGIMLDTVIPLDSRVKSTHLSDKSNSKKVPNLPKKRPLGCQDTAGSLYHSIQDEDVVSSDGEHDYQDIPDHNDKNRRVESHDPKYGQKSKGHNRLEKSASPPKLPPRNLNNSHSFDNSSLSSAGHEFDSMITGGASSTEDMSISSGCFDHEVTSPSFKTPDIMKSLYPKTSSPCLKSRLETGSDENMQNLSDSADEKGLRPVSGSSIHSGSWSGNGSHEAGHSSSDSDTDDDEKITRKNEKKLFMITREIVSSEKKFVDVLKLLNVDFRLHISEVTARNGRPVIPNEMLNRILDYLPQLEIFNEGLLKDLQGRLNTWDERRGIADVFVKKGPFLKLFSSYIRDFETITATLDEALKKYPQFLAAVKEFELSERCASLALKHYMLKPIQRIPQYRLLLQDYMKHLPSDSPEMKDMQTALDIVSAVATHANENMRHEDYVQKMLEIQRSLVGQFEVIKPGRIFVKEGELMKLSRKEMQPRYFFLFNDVLLYTTPVATGYRLNNVLPLAGMKVSVAAQDEYKMEFSIISVQRSFTLHGTTIELRDDWVKALNAAIDENVLKRNTFEAVRAGAQSILDKDFVLGHKAPLWIPDARVTMCMLCTCEFSVTWRRHHCRACGLVVCGNCSECKAPLRYLKYKSMRVCDKCYKTLIAAVEKDSKECTEEEEVCSKEDDDNGATLSLNGLFERFQKIRRSGRTEKRTGVRPDRLKEVSATDQEASMSGYLHKWHRGKKWKRQWYLVKDMVLYNFKATQDTAAAGSMVLLGYEVSTFTEDYEGVEPELLFQLSHANTNPIVFRTDSATVTQKWVTIMKESTVA